MALFLSKISRITIFSLLSLFSMASCKKFLDAKPDKKLVLPSTLQDAQALLDNYSLFNEGYPSVAAQSDDDFYLTDIYFNTLNIRNQNYHVWAKEATNDADWSRLYQNILNANVALEICEKIQPASNEINDWNRLKGGALFYRGYNLYHIAQLFAKPYNKATAAATPGVPIKLTSNINEPVVRSSVEATYNQIINDLTDAASLLPSITSPLSRPSKPAAFAALAKVYLIMDEYSLAVKFADSCLNINNSLIDYNTLNVANTAPFGRFNTEVIFPAVILGTGMLGVTNWHVDSVLYRSYTANDLRRSLYFQSNGVGMYGFKGSYDGITTGAHFNGIAVDEIYLIRAECYARLNNKDAALSDLNTLLVKRWKTGTFIPYTAVNPDDALIKILSERRKELVLRTLRWYDLRRLNTDPRFAKTIIRKLNGQVYQFPPEDSRYTFYIPITVIAFSGIEQNNR